MIDLIQEDAEHRTRALDVTQSFIVQAPAGSGKTELITQRILNLLSIVNEPEEILALTFTKKAAREMHERVIKALKDCEQNVLPQNKQEEKRFSFAHRALQQSELKNWNLLDQPNRLKIQTIDSFSSYLTRHIPILSLLGGNQRIAEFAKPHYEEALLSLLKNYLKENDSERSAAMHSILLSLDNNFDQLSRYTAELLSKRDQWLEIVHDPEFNQAGFLQNRNREVVLKLGKNLINAVVLRHVPRDGARSAPPRDERSLSCRIPFVPRRRASCAVSRDMPENDDSAQEYSSIKTWRDFADSVLTKDNEWRKRFSSDLSKERKAELKEFIELHEDDIHLKTILSELKNLPDLEENEDTAPLQHLFTLLKLLSAHLHLVFQQKNEIDFIENQAAAQRALGNEQEPTDLLLYLDYQIKHILIDEFQDTSFTQLHLLKKLTDEWRDHDGKTLFIVGDPMQSIYRFRQAEVGIFIRLFEEGLPNLTLHPLILHCNFRSNQSLIEWNNTCFSQIFPEKASAILGLVQFSPSVSMKEETSIIRAHEVISSEQGYASFLVEQIEHITSDHPNETIGILVRSRSHARRLIYLLKEKNIAFQAKDMMKFSALPHVVDLLTLVKIGLNTQDEFSWFAFLHAPWCGLDLNDLLNLKYARAPLSPLIKVILDSEQHTNASEEGRARLAKIRPILQHFMDRLHRQPFYEWLYDFWFALGGFAALKNESGRKDIHRCIQSIKKMNVNASTRIHDIEEQLDALYASESNDSPIHIMTIHGSKGLEFDHVILPHLEKSPSSDQKPLFTWTELSGENEERYFLISAKPSYRKPDSLYEFIHQKNNEKIKNERTRLFYVAATRAKKGIYFSSFRDRFCINESKEYKPSANSLLHLIWKSIEHTRTIVHAKEAGENTPASLSTFERFDLAWKHPFPLLTESILEQAHPEFLLHSGEHEIIGKMTHRILENIAQYSMNWWNQGLIAHEQNIKQGLLKQGLTSTEAHRHMRWIVEKINHFLTTDIAKWVFFPHQEAKSEFNITIHQNGKFKTRIIDRVFIDENKTRWIIDYKTSMPQYDQSLSAFLEQEKEHYRSQLNEYHQALANIDPITTRQALIFVFIPTLLTLD